MNVYIDKYLHFKPIKHNTSDRKWVNVGYKLLTKISIREINYYEDGIVIGYYASHNDVAIRCNSVIQCYHVGDIDCVYCTIKKIKSEDLELISIIADKSIFMYRCGSNILYISFSFTSVDIGSIHHPDITFDGLLGLRKCAIVDNSKGNEFDMNAPSKIFTICTRVRTVLRRKKIARYIAYAIIAEIAQNNRAIVLNAAFVAMIMSKY